MMSLKTQITTSLIILFGLISFSSLAQKVLHPDDEFEPNPYIKTYFKDNNNYAKVKSLFIVVHDTFYHKLPDTLVKKYYKNGQISIYQRYDDNKLGSEAIYTYDDKNLLKNYTYTNDKSVTSSSYSYDLQNRITKKTSNNSTISNTQIDSSPPSYLTYTYSDTYLLKLEKENYGRVEYRNEYKYEGSKLLECIGIISKKFEYDNNNNVIKIGEYIRTIEPKMLMKLKTYQFNENNELITDSILSSSDIKSLEYQTTNYSYHDNGDLKTMDVKYKDLSSHIEFIYQDSKIKQVDIRANSDSPYLRFQLLYKIQRLFEFPMTYQEIFEYDTHGNKTKKSTYVNNQFFQYVEFVIEYE